MLHNVSKIQMSSSDTYKYLTKNFWSETSTSTLLYIGVALGRDLYRAYYFHYNFHFGVVSHHGATYSQYNNGNSY